MYYLFKKDPWGNMLPVYAAQTSGSIMRYARHSRDHLWIMAAPGNMKVILGL